MSNLQGKFEELLKQNPSGGNSELFSSKTPSPSTFSVSGGKKRRHKKNKHRGKTTHKLHGGRRSRHNHTKSHKKHKKHKKHTR
jgi:hypothetical protein